jgi:hypothetical protein
MFGLIFCGFWTGKGDKMRKSYRVLILVVASLATAPAAVSASTIASVYTNGVTDNPYTLTGTVTYVLNTSATANTFILQDGTGGVLFYQIPTTAYAAPTAGQNITVTGTDDPYDGDQEFDATGFSFGSLNSTGLAPSATVLTIPQLNASYNGTAGIPPNSETYVELKGVTLPAGTTSLATGGTYILTDSSSNTATMYAYAGYSSVAAAVTAANTAETASGNTLFAGPLDVYGYVDPYTPDSEAEFYPVQITAVPEPAIVGLVSLGTLALIARRPRIA